MSTKAIRSWGKEFIAKACAVFLAICLSMLSVPLYATTALAANDESSFFTATVDGTELDTVAIYENAYEFFDGMTFIDDFVDVYLVAIPGDADTVTLTFDEPVLIFAYDHDDNLIEDYIDWDIYDEEGLPLGATSYEVAKDADGDGLGDYIQICSLYSMDDEGEYACTPYPAVTFVPAAGEFVAANSSTGAKLNLVDTIEGGYAYADMRGAKTNVDTYVIGIPQGTTEVDLSFPMNVLAYNYTESGGYLAGDYDYSVGVSDVTLKVDCKNRGEFDYIQVQSPYDGNWNTTCLYTITFREIPAQNPYDQEKFSELLNSLVMKFQMGGEFSNPVDSDGYNADCTVYAAVALNALGIGGTLDSGAIISGYDKLKDDSWFSAGTLAKYILAMTAAGIDCTDYEGENLISKMESMIGSSIDPYSAVWILPVYLNYDGNQDVADNAIDAIVASMNDQGMVDGGWGADFMTTAQAVIALAPYQDDEEIAALLEKSAETMIANIQDDGSMYEPYSKIDTTALAVAAFASLGIDPNEITAPDGSTMVGYLIGAADDELTGYPDAPYNEVATSGAALFGLISTIAPTDNIFNLRDVLKPVYRMYNPITSEHLFTTDFDEYSSLVDEYWVQEGVAWDSPLKNGVPVYRLYNAGLGALTKMSHHYTADRNEIEVMLQNGWVFDFDGAPTFYSAAEMVDGEQLALDGALPIYRMYNDGLSAHHYTLDEAEYADLTANWGWADEGIGFYAL